MDGTRTKFFLLGAGIVVSMALLIWAGMDTSGGFAYYLTVTEFSERETAGSQGFRVNGKVVEGTIDRSTSGQDVSFAMSDGTTDLRVRYHGIIPDTFVDGADVVVEGNLDESGQVFVAHTLLAKCPSKYEAAEDAAAGS